MQLPAIETLLDALVVSTRAHLAGHGIAEPLLVGIHSAGVWLAQHLACALGQAGLIGELDISFYRDDFTRVGMHPTVRPSRIPFEVEGRHLLLVDDVLYTGRTVRAVINELFDHGRPARVALAVLADRGGRELPVATDLCAATVTVPAGQSLELARDDSGRLRFVLEAIPS